MRFHVTLSLPGRNGQPTQFLICEAPVASIEDFHAMLNDEDHILVTECDTDPVTRELIPGEGVILNHAQIAKVSPYRERNARR